MVTLLSRYVNNLRKDRRAERSATRQTLRPPQRALAAIPKRSLVICTPPDARGSILRDCNHLWRVSAALGHPAFLIIPPGEHFALLSAWPQRTSKYHL